jgi:uncharacterized membrane protein
VYASLRRLGLAVITIASASACTQTESITDPGLQISAARPVSGPGYVAQEVGFLPGHVRSAAYGVNDLGYVVGESLPPASADPWHPHAFILAGNAMTALSERGRAVAVSGGSPVYVAGVDFTGGNNPARWTFDPVTGNVSEEIVGAGGEGVDINDAGLMIGITAPRTEASRATLWPVGQSPVTISPTGGYTRSTGRGINNAGYAAVTFSGGGNPARGFLVIDGGSPIELPPAAGHTMSFAGDVSEPVDGLVYVSGISAADTLDDYHLARWTVDVANRVVTSVVARKEVSEGRGASDEGVVPGQIEGKSSSSAIAWTLTGTIALKPTKGGSAAQANDISANGQYIAGSAIYKLARRGLLWTRAQ